MKAIHGGTAKHDQSDAQTIAVLRRGGMRPQASGSPAAMRAPRDVLRRRFPLPRQRAALRAHVQQTNSQDHLPEIGKTLADKTNRDGVADRFPAPAVQQSVAVALALIDSDERLRSDIALTRVQTAKAHKAQALYRRPSVPGIGQIVRVGLLYAIHALPRCPRVQDFGSSCRLGKCAKEAAGNRDGTSGAKSGKTPLKGAFAAAAVLLLRNQPADQTYRARLAPQPGKGQAFPIFAHKCARAV